MPANDRVNRWWPMVDPAPRVRVKILDPRLEAWGLPRHHSAMAAAIDLRACLDEPVVLPPGAPAVLIPSGIAVHMGDPHMMAVIAPRSGSGHRGLVLGNLVGIIDADYTGPVMISAWNRGAPGTEPVVIEPGERIAQMVFVPILRPVFETVTEFPPAGEPPGSTPGEASGARGASGFGSTGRG